MKTIEQVQQDLINVEKEILSLDLTVEKALTINRLRAKKRFYEDALLYLQTNPSSDFLKKELNGLSSRLDAIMLHFNPLPPEKFSQKECSKHKKKFEDLWGIQGIKQKISALSYLLNPR